MQTLLLQANGGLLTNGLFMAAMLVVLIFFMIIPQRRKAKEQTAFADDLKKGDQVVTASGILGHIDKIDDKIITLNVGNKTYIRVTRNAISKDLTDAIFPTDVDKQ
ncbi:preprotein translocase subunit YajC [Neolewinella antarctica]|uniref:Sec translocon accessory complex subunit YajC n=1 Tax=Neolewinella antarctica TaxID=442734 RepID=A0ABX0XC14_9BACT|nr:preprotein translocase subunit YajC [Neolewinella antarctica]NJC26494.1 preprotein translocase subunit YajC [Neolewinella antarctica]